MEEEMVRMMPSVNTTSMSLVLTLGLSSMVLVPFVETLHYRRRSQPLSQHHSLLHCRKLSRCLSTPLIAEERS
ncbi:hypothetical protein Bca52824_078125 [Brassica carinata]|uniref:Uncharacterized protein n=1 Tax=Brassica carinata TaxID=52824 RepID=A0A8X7U0P0_BRACI|nr:hypothetical protein Bca52824_078125 [Brassica carinata]